MINNVKKMLNKKQAAWKIEQPVLNSWKDEIRG
jgi:hypothetical protein